MTFKYILLPVWLACCKYDGKLYYFLINGYTGKVTGEYPRSEAKVTCQTLGIIAATSIGIFLFCFVPWGAVVLAAISLLFGFWPSKDSDEKPKLTFVKGEEHTQTSTRDLGSSLENLVNRVGRLLLMLLFILPFLVPFILLAIRDYEFWLNHFK